MLEHEHFRRADKIAIGADLATILIAIIAVIVSIVALVQPRPADPTLVHNFGTPSAPIVIADSSTARALIRFISDHTGRKVRIYARFAAPFFGYEDQKNAPRDGVVMIPEAPCPDQVPLRELELGVQCRFIELDVRPDSDEVPGVFYSRPGAWLIYGYYASAGESGAGASGGFSYSNYSITKLTDVEATS